MNNQKGFANILLVILVIVLVAIVVIGGYFVFYRSPQQKILNNSLGEQQKNDMPQQGEERGGLIVVPSDGSTVDASNLSLHKNESCGLEIKFPSQFTNKETEQCPKYSIPPEIPISNYQAEASKADFVGCGGAPVDYIGYKNGLMTPCSYYYKKIQQYERPINALSLTSRADCKTNESAEYPAGCQLFSLVVANNKIVAAGGGVLQKTDIIVDNLPAEKIVEIDGDLGEILVQFEKNKLWYRYLHTFNSADLQDAEKLSKLIISTFKFIP